MRHCTRLAPGCAPAAGYAPEVLVISPAGRRRRALNNAWISRRGPCSCNDERCRAPSNRCDGLVRGIPRWRSRWLALLPVSFENELVMLPVFETTAGHRTMLDPWQTTILKDDNAGCRVVEAGWNSLRNRALGHFATRSSSGRAAGRRARRCHLETTSYESAIPALHSNNGP